MEDLRIVCDERLMKVGQSERAVLRSKTAKKGGVLGGSGFK